MRRLPRDGRRSLARGVGPSSSPPDTAFPIEAQLRERYGANCRIERPADTAAAGALLDDLVASGADLALVTHLLAADRVSPRMATAGC